MPKTISRTKTFFGPAATGNIFIRSHCRYLSFSSSVSAKHQHENRFPREYLGKSMSTHTDHPVEKLRLIKLSPKAANDRHAMIQLTEVIDRPYTSNYEIRESESSLERDQRPLTNVANTRFRPKRNKFNTYKTEKS